METKNNPHHEMKIHVPNFFTELFNNNPTLGSIWKIPALTLRNYIGQIAERAAELNDNKLNALMAQMALFEVTDPTSKEYDQKLTKELISKKYK